jgi:hypothetical protein
MRGAALKIDDRLEGYDPLGDPRIARLVMAERSRAERVHAFRAEQARRKALTLDRPSLLRRLTDRLARRR